MRETKLASKAAGEVERGELGLYTRGGDELWAKLAAEEATSWRNRRLPDSTHDL
jgi:hypothetical protein